MTTKEAVALLERYSNYDGMGIPNLAGCKEAMRVAVDALKEACPEIVESEDERIRKYFIWIVKNVLNNIQGLKLSEEKIRELIDYYSGIKESDILAWLEKQKENIEKEYVFRPLAGTDITIAAEQAIRRANEGDRLLLAFNGAYIPVRRGCNANKIVDIYEAFIEKQKEQSLRNFIDDFPYSIERKEQKSVEFNEDEKIRKEIINYILYKADGVSEEQEHSWIAYLEKRKDLDKMIVVSPEVWDNAITDAYENGKKDGEKQKEPHYTKRNALFDKCVENCDPAVMKKVSDEIDEMLEKEQKPAEWSEDYREEDIQTRFAFYTYKDELGTLYLSNVFVEESSRNHGFGTKILRAAEKVAETIGATTICLKVKQDSPANAWYRKNGYGYVAFEDGYDWLEKNLEYMKPNKQEWSVEDEKDIVHITRILDDCYAYGKHDLSKTDHDNLTSMIKSLRPVSKDSLQSWKPTEEQMRTLDIVISDYRHACTKNSDKKAEILKPLLEQLKKL